MTDDIVERLRDKDGRWLSQYCKPHQVQELRDEAADEIRDAAAEIERLRARLSLIGTLQGDPPITLRELDMRAEIERLRKLNSKLTEHDGGVDAVCDSYATENQRFYDEIERLRSIVAVPAFVPDRPVWLDINGLPDADWHQQRLLSVTQGTLELARQAMQIRYEESSNHLYVRAISEINQVIASESKP